MGRINIYEVDEVEGDHSLIGWFDPDRATTYAEDTEWDGSNHISVPTGSQWDHEELYLTAQGRWVLSRYSNWQGKRTSYEFVDSARAQEWLVANSHDEAAEKHFGKLEEERGPGRPETGTPVHIRLPAELLAQLDARSVSDGVTRAEMVRRLVAAGLA